MEEYKNLIGRVIHHANGLYLVQKELIIYECVVSGRFRYEAKLLKDYPTVGDYVDIKVIQDQKAIIQKIMPRKTAFVRKVPISGGRKLKDGKIDGGLTEEQVIAANIDVAFIVTSLDYNFNIRRLERFITLVYNSGATPVIILNKADICPNVEEYIFKVKQISNAINVYAVSAATEYNMEIFKPYLKEDLTVVFLGSSGVGKSTITNYLFHQEMMKTSEISEITKKGRHTTTMAQLFVHESGLAIIDTPGIRELQLWGDESTIDQSFQDIVDITKQCKFTDCKHENEPGCAIKKALKTGKITEERFMSYLKQLGEIKTLSKKQREFERNMNRKNKKNRYQ